MVGHNSSSSSSNPHHVQHPIAPRRGGGGGLGVNLMRAILFLLVLSAVVNLIYHSHLPNPTHELAHQIALVERLVVEGSSSSNNHNRQPEMLAQVPLKQRTKNEQENDQQTVKLKDSEQSEQQIKEEEEEEAVEEEAVEGRLLSDKQYAELQKPPPVSVHLQNKKKSLWKSDGQAQQVVKKDKHGNPLHHNIHQVQVADLAGIGEDTANKTSLTIEEASVGREPLLEILRDAGVTEMDARSIAKLPTWEQVVSLYGEGPVVYGLETCQNFRDKTPKAFASIGVAGLFNTGTNPFAMYLSANCEMPDNTHDKSKGMRWQVPWGKHMLAERKWTNTAAHDLKVSKADVLPVAMIRDPYSWMQSMCRHPYAARFVHNADHCPILVPTPHDVERHESELKGKESVPVDVGYPNQHARFPSLVHFWSTWYRQYLEADYPRLIVRFEDLVFHPKELLSIVCECGGAVPKDPNAFSYVVGEAKWGSKVHEGSSNMISAMIRYGSTDQRKHRFFRLTADDLEFSRKHLDPELLRIFQYHPIPPPDNELRIE